MELFVFHSCNAGLQTLLSFSQIFFLVVVQVVHIESFTHLTDFLQFLFFLLQTWQQHFGLVFFFDNFMQSFLLFDFCQSFIVLLFFFQSFFMLDFILLTLFNQFFLLLFSFSQNSLLLLYLPLLFFFYFLIFISLFKSFPFGLNFFSFMGHPLQKLLMLLL